MSYYAFSKTTKSRYSDFPLPHTSLSCLNLRQKSDPHNPYYIENFTFPHPSNPVSFIITLCMIILPYIIPGMLSKLMHIQFLHFHLHLSPYILIQNNSLIFKIFEQKLVRCHHFTTVFTDEVRRVSERTSDKYIIINRKREVKSEDVLSIRKLNLS